jgi:hypothetical protein
VLGYNHEWRLISPVTTVDELFALTKEKGCLEPMSCRIRLLASRWRLHPTTSIIFSILFSGASGYVLAFWMVQGTFGWRLYPGCNMAVFYITFRSPAVACSSIAWRQVTTNGCIEFCTESNYLRLSWIPSVCEA